MGEGPHLPNEPIFFSFFVSVAFLAVDPAIPLHCTCYCFTYHFTSCYPVGLRVDAPTVPTYFFINLLLRASLVQFPHLYLFWALLANIHVVPTHFIISFLKLSQPIYFFFTSFTYMGFLLDPLGFLGPITTSLPLVTFRAYWPLSQTNEFTNSFSGFLWPIYILFTSYYSKTYYFILRASLAQLLPFYLFLFFKGSLATNPAISACWAYFLIPLLFFLSNILYIVRFLLLLGPFPKVGIKNIKGVRN